MYRILVADDEPIERTIITKMLQKYYAEQLEVVTAINGREAVSLYREKKCSIALLDIEMPGVNGLEAAEQIRSQDDEAIIVFLTAFDEFSYAKRAISIHALEYLLKPAVDEELIATLDEALLILGAERTIRVNRSDPEKNIRYSDNAKLNAVAENICEYIRKYYQDDISLQDVAGHMNYSDAYFCKIFKQCFDKSFLSYLTEYRVDRAKELLEDISINIKDVSSRVGYRDSNYFAKVFKRIVGETPSEYRVRTMELKMHRDES